MRAALLVQFLLLAGCMGADPGALPDGGTAFAPWSLVDDAVEASEPFVALAPDGALYVSAMPGNTDARPYGLGEVSRLWRSDDDGVTWRRLAPHAGLMGDRGAGGGDSAIAIAPRHGTLFVSDLWGAQLEASASTDGGASWTRVPLASTMPYLDRQWMVADLEGRGYIFARSFYPGLAQWVLRSDDAGVSWDLMGRSWTMDAGMSAGALTSNVVVHPIDGSLHTLFGCSADGRRLCVTSSRDAGVTWEQREVTTAEAPIGDIFPVLAASPEGVLHAAWIERSDGRGGSLSRASSVDGGRTWSASSPVATDGSGTLVFPALVAGEGGALAFAWYGSARTFDPNSVDEAGDEEWHVWVARLQGSAQPERWEVVRASHAPVHRGSVSTVGASPAAEAPDWSLGDLLSLATTRDGRLVVAFTVGTEGEGAPHAAVARQNAGPRLVAPFAGSSFNAPVR